VNFVAIVYILSLATPIKTRFRSWKLHATIESVLNIVLHYADRL